MKIIDRRFGDHLLKRRMGCYGILYWQRRSND